MSAPASKLAEFAAELNDLSRPLQPFRALQIERELRRLLVDARRDMTLEVHLYLGVLYHRMGKFKRALEANEVAARLSNRAPRVLINLAANLLQLGRLKEAVEVLLDLIDVDGPHLGTAYLNLATGLIGLGFLEEAQDALDHAAQLCQPVDAEQAFHLALVAAPAGLDQQAVLYYAWFLRLSDGKPRDDGRALETLCSAEDPELLSEISPELARAVQIARSFAQARAITNPSEEESLHEEETIAVFEATRPLRQRANAKVLGGIVAVRRFDHVRSQLTQPPGLAPSTVSFLPRKHGWYALERCSWSRMNLWCSRSPGCQAQSARCTAPGA